MHPCHGFSLTSRPPDASRSWCLRARASRYFGTYAPPYPMYPRTLVPPYPNPRSHAAAHPLTPTEPTLTLAHNQAPHRQISHATPSTVRYTSLHLTTPHPYGTAPSTVQPHPSTTPSLPLHGGREPDPSHAGQESRAEQTLASIHPALRVAATASPPSHHTPGAVSWSSGRGAAGSAAPFGRGRFRSFVRPFVCFYFFAFSAGAMELG